MDERLRFVARLLEGEKMAPLCAEFGISRKTGYKIFERYKDCGVAGVQRPQSPTLSPGQSAAAAARSDDCAPEARVSRLGRAEDPRKAAAAVHRARICRQSARSTRSSTGMGWCTAAGAGADRATGTALSRPAEPNALWCADYKGEFMLGNRRYCYPLTITDFASRYLLTCEALSTTQEKFAFTVFERTFKEFGLPRAIRTDNGVPFASAHALYGLSKLAVWWLRLGIQHRTHRARAARNKTGGTSGCISP